MQDGRVRLLDFSKEILRELDAVDWEKLTRGQSASGKWETLKEEVCYVQGKYIPMRYKS